MYHFLMSCTNLRKQMVCNSPFRLVSYDRLQEQRQVVNIIRVFATTGNNLYHVKTLNIIL